MVDRCCQAARGRDVAKEDSGQGITAHLAWIVRFEHRGDIAEPSLASNPAAVDEDDDHLDTGRAHSLDELLLPWWKGQVRAIVPLTLHPWAIILTGKVVGDIVRLAL